MPRAAAYASSAIWALVYHGEKVKAALRRLPSAHERLLVVKATCEFQLGKLTRAAAVIKEGIGNIDSNVDWLRHAHRNIELLLATLNATSTAVGVSSSPSLRKASLSGYTTSGLGMDVVDGGGRVKAAWISSPLKKGVQGWATAGDQQQII